MSDADAGAAPAPAIVVESRAEAGPYRVVHLARPDRSDHRRTLARHRIAGQYVLIGRDAADEPAPFAIAAPPAPGTDAVELLVRSGSPIADHLAARSPGDQVLMSEPDGPGFDLAAARGADLLLLAAGSGIAPVRAAAHAIAADRGSYGDVALYYGQHHEADFAFRDDLDDLARHHIRLVLVVSGDQPDWTGHRGYVQRLADAEWQHWNAILMCGMPEMEAETRSIARRRRVPLLLTNTGTGT